MTYLEHITLSTGHSRRSYRAEVSASTIAALDPVVRAALTGTAPIPGMPRYRLKITARGRSAMVATIFADDRPIITLGVARDSRAGAGLWPVICRDTEPLDMRRPAAPWLAVHIEASALTVPGQDLAAMGDLERCIAWTWLEMRE